MFVDPEDLVKNYNINIDELKTLKKLSKTKKVNYDGVKLEKRRLLDIAYNNLTKSQLNEVKEFLKKNES
jgi:4-alpha-glucanotransferase